MIAEDLIARLDAARRTGPGRWVATCPSHHDRHPSLSVRALDDGRVLIHCHAGCSPESVVAAIGLSMFDLMPARARDTSDGPGGSPGLRRPWPAEDVLRAVAHEAYIAGIAIENVARGEPLSTADRDRARLATERIRDAAVLGATL